VKFVTTGWTRLNTFPRKIPWSLLSLSLKKVGHANFHIEISRMLIISLFIPPKVWSLKVFKNLFCHIVPLPWYGNHLYLFFLFSIISTTPQHSGVNFTNILRAAFFTKVFCAAFLYLQFGYVIFWLKNVGAKAVHKMLVKLTTDSSTWRSVRHTCGRLSTTSSSPHHKHLRLPDTTKFSLILARVLK